MMRRRMGLGILLSWVVLAAPRAAVAAVDMSGEWYVEYAALGGLLPAHATFTQSGTSLTMLFVLSGPSGIPSTSVGTIDPDTGEFSVTTIDWPGGPLVTQGTAAPDSYTFSASVTDGGNGVGSLSGSRCGNGALDATEQCDDGNRSNLDCCANTCTFSSAGTRCADDNVLCTDSVCDGAGACTHPFSAVGTGCHADNEYCTTETCDGAGGCSVTGFIPAGTQCPALDGEYFCTLNTCNGAGTCEHTPQNEGATCQADSSACTIDQCVAGACTTVGAPTCARCEVCDNALGCVGRQTAGCPIEHERHGSGLRLVDEAGTADDLITWNRTIGSAGLPHDIGAESSAYGATLCVFDRATSAVVASAQYPPGASWSGNSTRARFQQTGPSGRGKATIKRPDPSRNLYGVSASAKASGQQAQILQLPDVTSTLAVELRHGNGRCLGIVFGQESLKLQSSTARRYRD